MLDFFQTPQPRQSLPWKDDLLLDSLLEQSDDLVDHVRNFSGDVQQPPEVVQGVEPSAAGNLDVRQKFHLQGLTFLFKESLDQGANLEPSIIVYFLSQTAP